MENAIFATRKTRADRSSQPRVDKIASAQDWHLKLGHAGPEAVAHLPEAVIGAKLDGRGPSTVECETCALSKAKQIISRHPIQPEEKPFERIHWDLISMTRAYNGDRYIS